MQNKIKTSTQVIEGYSTSRIAESETNDCVVKAVAVVLGVPYDQAHELVRVNTGRQNRNGVKMGKFSGWLLGCSNPVITEQPDESWKSTPYGTQDYYWPKTVYINRKQGKKIFCKMSVGSFLKLYPSGRYYVVTRGHVFAVVDGEVIGNPSDATKLRTTVKCAFHHS